jgi:flagellar biosynthetic protein FliQ
MILHVAREGLILAILVSAPAVVASLGVAILVGALQAASRIQDPAIVILPKLVVALTVLLLSGSLLTRVVEFTHRLLVLMPTLR